MHGAHKSRNVPRGVDHPQYKNGSWTKETLEENRISKCRLALLEQVGWHLKMFTGTKTRGKKPKGFPVLDLTNPEQLATAIALTLKENTP